jgi:TolB protein
MNKMNLLFAALAVLLNLSAFAQQGAIGIFDSQSDVGEKTKPGSGVYLPQTRQYVVSGAGENIWNDHDEFHFVYKRVKGDFILTTRADFVGWNGVEMHRKMGWMVRKSLDANSPHVNAVVHGDGLTSLQFRRTAGAKTEEIHSKTDHANIIQLERKGNTYTMRVAKFGEPYVTEQVSDIDLGEDVYVGLFIGSHNADANESAVFSNVRIAVPFPDNKKPAMILGSNLEVMEITTGDRDIIYSVPYSIQAPNWTPDNKTLIFNDEKGTLYRFDLASRNPEILNTGGVKSNNDHVISFDGKMLGISCNTKQGSIIYTVPITGGIAKQITPTGPSYLHGWSPDGKSLVFCGQRNGDFDVYRVPAKGGPEEQLTNTRGLDDGPEYSPDGKYIYFNSVRSGTMQIWRMKADGSEQEQVTNDDFNNWFAHVSPDGKWLAFISFLKDEVDPGLHPAYKHVYIRLMSTKGGKIKTLAYFYGGQGSINTPSWSPDSKRIAFISNSDMSDNVK